MRGGWRWGVCGGRVGGGGGGGVGVVTAVAVRVVVLMVVVVRVVMKVMLVVTIMNAAKVCTMFDDYSTSPPTHQLLASMSAPDCTKSEEPAYMKMALRSGAYKRRVLTVMTSEFQERTNKRKCLKKYLFKSGAIQMLHTRAS